MNAADIRSHFVDALIRWTVIALILTAGVAVHTRYFAQPAHADTASVETTWANCDPDTTCEGLDVEVAAPMEDDPRYSCTVAGNHICGPNNNNGAPAGLYLDGELIQPWTNYDQPELDPLYGVMPGTEYDHLGGVQI